jgi:arsenate reductase
MRTSIAGRAAVFQAAATTSRSAQERASVLFLCVHNSCRSQMAEALLRRHAGRRVEAYSAGLCPSLIHPLTRRVLEEIDIDTRSMRSKGVDTFLRTAAPIGHAIIVCERGQAHCPRLYPFARQCFHWPFPDPAAVDLPEFLMLEKFRKLRDRIDQRIREWVADELE